MKTILITGGAGFIGSHTADLLLAQDYKLVIVDNLSSGINKNLPKEAVFRNVSVASPRLEDVFKEFKFDAIIHLAALIDVQRSIEHPEQDIDINLGGTMRILELAKAYGIDKIVFASSAAVYGEPESLPLTESHRTAPISVYGVSKLASELLLQAYTKRCGLSVVCLRYSNVYGPRQLSSSEGGVVAIFLQALLSDKSPVIFGDGSQSRDFVFVKDVTSANRLALDAVLESQNPFFKVLNISNNTQTSITELHNILSSIHQSENFSKPVFKPAKKGDILHSCLDISSAKSFLGWSPKVSLQEGLHETLNSLKCSK